MSIFNGFLSLILLLIITIAICVGALAIAFTARGPSQDIQSVMIEQGMGTRQIAAELSNKNIIYSDILFIIGSKIMNGGESLKAGEYEFPANASTNEILKIIQSGQIIERKFTIPEGLTSWEIVQILNNVDHLEGEISTIPPEGSLMPDTYFYMRGERRTDVIGRMQQAMQDFTATLDQTKLSELPFDTMEEAMILASIIEKETAVPEEYERVSGVFVNRLRKGMMLQTDPTVIYGITLGEHQNEGKGPLGRRLLRKDLRVDTPYNTYTRTGLTPTPIANPGRAAIQAALNPEKHDYYYFVADGTGGHAFGKTLDDHNRNVAKWRKIRAAQ
jgi:UPF0755 protein